MKKLLFLLPVLFVPSVVNAAAVCRNFYIKEGSSQPTSGSQVAIWGSITGASSYSYTYYKRYTMLTTTYEYDGWVAAVTSLTCNTSNGYTKKTVEQSVCLNSSTATPSVVTVYKCACYDYDTYTGSWTDYSTSVQRQSGTRKNCGTSSTIYRYRCKSGYYSAAGYDTASSESTLQCTTCPANATCDAGAKTFTCNAGYYKDGSGCTACATTCGAGHTTSAAGATSYAECKAPAATMLTDDKGTFSYSTACCCDDTCDSKCDSGKSCDIDSDCGSDQTCKNGCCETASACETMSCTSNTECTTGGYMKCLNGCCTGKAPSQQLSCTLLSEDYCTISDTSNCTAREICNPLTNCCELKTIVIQ